MRHELGMLSKPMHSMVQSIDCKSQSGQTMNPLVTPMAKDGPEVVERSKVQCDESSIHWTYLKNLMKAEQTSYPCPWNYIDSSTANDANHQPHGMTETLRSRIVEWMFSLMDHFGIDRECALIAINYVDRTVARQVESTMSATSFTSSSSSTEQESPSMLGPLDFQRIAVASVFLAVKIHGVFAGPSAPESETKRVKISIKHLVHMGRNRFSEEELCASEVQILKDLDWKLNPPTALRSLTSIVSLIPVWTPSGGDMRIFLHSRNAIFELSRYLIELSVCRSQFCFQFAPSLIAYASILCAIDALKDHIDLPYQVRAALLNSLSQLPGLSPQNPKVRKTKRMLRELCPVIFQQGEFPVEFQSYLSRIVEADQATAEVEEDEDSREEEEATSNSNKASPVTVIISNGRSLDEEAQALGTPDHKKRKQET